MNVNKILIASIISTSFLFTGFKANAPKPWRFTGYEDFTYEEVLKEERTDTKGQLYTYFEYSVTNTGDAYVWRVCQEGVSDIRLDRMDVGNVFQNDDFILLPNSTGTYSCEVYGYTNQNVYLVAEAYLELADGVSYGPLNCEYLGTTSYITTYKHQYAFSIDVSYIEETPEHDNQFYDYYPLAIIEYKGKIYSFSFEQNESVVLYANEELDLEQLSLHDVIVIRHLGIEQGSCIVKSPISWETIATIFVIVTIGLPLVGALVPIVILIVYKSKKPKERQS